MTMKRITLDHGELIEADDGWYPVQYFGGVRIAKKADTGANEGDLIFTFFFPSKVFIVVEASNHHIRGQQIERVHRHYRNAMMLLHSPRGGKK